MSNRTTNQKLRPSTESGLFGQQSLQVLAPFPTKEYLKKFQLMSKNQNYPKNVEPLLGEFRPTTERFMPDYWKIGTAAKIMRYSDCVVEIENDVPPAAWYENSFPRTL